MSTEESSSSGEMLESKTEDSPLKLEKQLAGDVQINGNVLKENGMCDDGNVLEESTNEQLLQMVIELKFQNEFFKSQFEGLKSQHEAEENGQESGESADVKELHEKIQSLNRELNEEKQTRGAAEIAMEHLREEYSEADAKAQELSLKLAEAQQKLDQEIKEREEKYTELDSKFQRLHKRAKQRIQEVQKEKDDLEARFHGANEAAKQALSEQSSLKQELERTRQQANEALKAMDAERQQLRSANNKLRDNIEELRCSLQPKESALEALQQTLLEKEQMLGDMQGLLQTAEEKKQASMTELSAKHQKNIENLEGQIADALADRNKAAETISKLQVLIAEKESKIAEMDAASSGETARLRAALESVKGELAHQKHEHEKEKESWEAASQALKTKLEIAESNCIHAEIGAAKMKSQLELEVSVQSQMLSKKDAELLAVKEEINRLESEFSSYKVRAHSLLQKKDAELAAAMDSEQLKAIEEALKEAETEVSLASVERDKALQDLQEALANNDKELAIRDAALNNAMQQIKSLETKLDSANVHLQSEKETWKINLQNLEESWRLRCEALKAENEVPSGQDIQRELEELELKYKKLKEEHDSFRELADRMMEEKDKEISKLVDSNRNLHQSMESRPHVNHNDDTITAMHKQDGANLSTSIAEQQILLLARQQAQREEELAQSQRHILALQEEIEELERENRLHGQQEAMLKTELRNMERTQKRDGVDLTYLKNVILKLLETGEVEALLPVVAMLLQFSPEEVQKCQAYRASTDVPPSPASDTSGSGLSLFSRFSFS
ncbi:SYNAPTONEMAL COMPLEX PROTEIN-RELATED [Salix purpurea]|uniref:SYNAPTONEMAL COMPLEX PROTEIN-RELATED n=1 Tax=Salix purpurea TaxID=77065 RepID=A0A9Q0WWI4_SALPP|nr:SYNAPTONEMAL COMPLEX PROTEIN-RELATED [Salix purpurea]